MDKMPPLPDFNDIDSIMKWNEALKKRLKDAGQKVDDDPLDFQKNKWPRPLPYEWPQDKRGSFVV